MIHMNRQVLGLVAGLCFVSYVEAQEQSSVVRIEEDWELVVNYSDPSENLPSVQTTILPGGRDTTTRLELLLNHATHPNFSPGGYQLRVVAGEKNVGYKRAHKGRRLVEGEVIRWTQVVQKSDDGIYFGILNGQSETWGRFGGATSFIFLPNKVAGFEGLDAYRADLSQELLKQAEAKKPAATIRLLKVRVSRDGQEQPETRLISMPNKR
ncbi:MAG: hypothetical protein Aurels2KO_16460 [Aureliella sp.]